MGGALHQIRNDIGVPGIRQELSGAVSRCASAIPWRKFEPDALISPLCSFAGVQLTGNARGFGPSRKQFSIRLRAESRLIFEFASEPGAASPDTGGVERPTAHPAAARAAPRYGNS